MTKILFFFLILTANCGFLKHQRTHLEQILQKICMLRSDSEKFCGSKKYFEDVETYGVLKLDEEIGENINGSRRGRRTVDERKLFYRFVDVYCCADYYCLYECNPELRIYKNAVVKGFPANIYLLNELDRKALFNNSPWLKYRHFNDFAFYPSLSSLSPEGKNCSLPEKITILPERLNKLKLLLTSHGKYFDELLAQKYPKLSQDERNHIFSDYEDVVNLNFPANIAVLRFVDWNFFTSQGMTEEDYWELKNGTASCKMVHHWKILAGAFKHHFAKKFDEEAKRGFGEQKDQEEVEGTVEPVKND